MSAYQRGNTSTRQKQRMARVEAVPEAPEPPLLWYLLRNAPKLARLALEPTLEPFSEPAAVSAPKSFYYG